MSALLVTVYGLVALAGHGLHALQGCEDPRCGEAAACAPHDGCAFCVRAAQQAAEAGTAHKAPTSECAFRAPAAGHDAAGCAVCSLLSLNQLCSAAPAALPWVEAVPLRGPVLNDPAPRATFSARLSARGPPAAA